MLQILPQNAANMGTPQILPCIPYPKVPNFGTIFFYTIKNAAESDRKTSNPFKFQSGVCHFIPSFVLLFPHAFLFLSGFLNYFKSFFFLSFYVAVLDNLLMLTVMLTL